MAAAAAGALSGCTTIQAEQFNIHTVAVDCDVERGEFRDGAGQGEANVLAQAGAAGARFTGALHSRVRCPGGHEVVVETRGKAEQPPEPAP